MNKIGIYKIGFKEQNEVNDQWVQQEQEQAQRDIPVVYIDGSHWYKSIDQTATDLTEDLVIDDSGPHYEVSLPFVVRKEEDTELAKKYAGRPVVVYAIAVDGKRYTIGSKSYPAYLVISNRYQSKTSLLR